MAQRYPNTPQIVDAARSRSKLKYRELERCISCFGENVEVPLNFSRYATCQTPVVATGMRGKAPGELDYPYGVDIHEETHQIFLANYLNHRVEIFSETGEFISQLGLRHLSNPNSIAIIRDSVYVSCWGDHTVSKFSLTEMCQVNKIGGVGSNNGQFKYPRQLTTDHVGRVFIADYYNNRICIHDPDLNHLFNITYRSMSRPFYVKVPHNHLYVLCPGNNLCLHVLTFEGDKLRYLISCGEGMNVLGPLLFCLDPFTNFLFSDLESCSIRVFAQEVNLLHMIRREGRQLGVFFRPRGVAVTPNGRLVRVLQNENFGLQVF